MVNVVGLPQKQEMSQLTVDKSKMSCGGKNDMTQAWWRQKLTKQDGKHVKWGGGKEKQHKGEKERCIHSTKDV